MTDNNTNPSRLTHYVLLSLGFLLGTVAAYYFNLIDFTFSWQLEKARRLGMISYGILNNESEIDDTIQYLTVYGFPVLAAIGLWWVWARTRKDEIRPLLSATEEASSPVSPWQEILLFLVPVVYLLAYFDLNKFSMANDGWQFLGEEGEILAWVEHILHGEVYGREFDCIYGPMLVYPVVWAMKLFGTSVLVQRCVTFAMNIGAYAIVLAFLRRELRSRALFVTAALVYLTAFPAQSIPSPNATFLRAASGIMPLLLCSLYLEKKRTYLLAGIGVTLGQSFLFSQEVSVCSGIALALMLVLSQVAAPGRRRLLREAVIVLAGLVVSVFPMLCYFYSRNALAGFFAALSLFPQLFSLGFNTRPFVDFEKFIADPFGTRTYFPYWVILVYIVCSLSLIPRLALLKPDRRLIVRTGILVFGLLLYRSAIGRYDQYHVFFASPPAFLLVFLMIDDAVRRGVDTWCTASRAALAATVIPLFLVSVPSHGLKDIRKSLSEGLGAHWVRTATGIAVPELERGGIYWTEEQARTISGIGKFLRKNTAPGDYVYFFPNEAAYYFLFDRRNPTRYVVSYLAVTASQRRRLIDDLERTRPTYVVYSLNTWRLDNIQEIVQEPEVVQYLFGNYRMECYIGNVTIMKRRAA